MLSKMSYNVFYTLLLLTIWIVDVNGGLKDWRNCPLTNRRYFPASHTPVVLNGRQGTFTPRPGNGTRQPQPIRQGYGHNLRKVGFELEDLYVNRDDVTFGTNITWGMRWRIDEELTKGTIVKLDIYRDLTLFGLFPLVFRIPCVQGFGSCVYDACEELPHSVRVCEYMTRNGEACSCPIKAKTYEVYYDSLVLPILEGAGARMINVSFNGF